MAESQPDIPEYILVTCRICGARLHPRPRQQARKIKCPDCFTPVQVPSLQEVVAKLEKQRARKAPQTEIGTYKLALDGEPSEPDEETVAVICRVCRARLHPEVGDEPRTTVCPDCFTEVDVPSRHQAAERIASGRSAHREPEVYRAGMAPDAERPGLSHLDAMAEIREEEPPEPPQWTFLSGVFTFPWSQGVLSRWAWMAFGLTLLVPLDGLVVVLLIWLLQSTGGYGGVGIAFLVLPFIWLNIWILSYSGAVCLPVIVETAGGNDRITGWPEPHWKEWAIELCYLAFIAICAQVVAHSVGLLASWLGGPYWTTSLVALGLLFPVMLLSSLEAASPWVPLTLPILRSLLVSCDAWLGFYAVAVPTLAAGVGLTTLISFASPILAAFLGGPVAATVLLIEARLLGRLGWRIVEDASELSLDTDKQAETDSAT